MSEPVIIAAIGLVGAIIGGIITSIPVFIQERSKHKRWVVEKRILFLEDQIKELEQAKKQTLNDLRNLFAGKKFSNNNDFVFSVPMEVIEIFEKVFKEYLSKPESVVWVKDLTEVKKREIIIDVAAALETKKIELREEIKKMVA